MSRIKVEAGNKCPSIVLNCIHRTIGKVGQRILHTGNLKSGQTIFGTSIGELDATKLLACGMECTDHMPPEGITVEPGERDIAILRQERIPTTGMAFRSERNKARVVLMHLHGM
jgi:hypothetical protein